MKYHQFKMKTSSDIREKVNVHRDRLLRLELLDRADMELDYSSRREENGRIYYDLYRRDGKGNRIKINGLCAFDCF